MLYNNRQFDLFFTHNYVYLIVRNYAVKIALTFNKNIESACCSKQLRRMFVTALKIP